MVYTISIESVWKVQSKPIIVIFVYCGSLWVIGVPLRCVSCSQHLVVVVSENAGTALVWNSNGRFQYSVMAVQVWNQSVLQQRK